jgi:hypothetical protein
MESFDESNTFNSDQSGFNYILTSVHTLSEESERVTLSSVLLLNNTIKIKINIMITIILQ